MYEHINNRKPLRIYGTPVLNKDRESVLLSEIGDHKSLAMNMIKALEDERLANTLKSNALKTAEDRYGNNRQRALHWVEVYKACIDNFNHGVALPENVLNKN